MTKTLKQFEAENLNKGNKFIKCNKCKIIKNWNNGEKYLVALSHTWQGWDVVNVERKDGKAMVENEVMLGAYGATYDDCIDALFWC